MVEGSFVGVSGLVREPCFLLVGEISLFVFRGGTSSFVGDVVDRGFSMETSEEVEGYRIRCLAVRFFKDRMPNTIEDLLRSSHATLDYSFDPMKRLSQDSGIWKQDCLVAASLVAY